MFPLTDKIFITKLIELTNENFRCIDIGFTNKWIIVEINHPYSLDDYEIPIENYMEFCINSFKKINKIICL